MLLVGLKGYMHQNCIVLLLSLVNTGKAVQSVEQKQQAGQVY